MSFVRIGRAVGLIGALGIAAVISASPASAQVSSNATSAITSKRKTLPSSLVTGYFQSPVTSTPVAGEVGGGAYQSFTGKSGSGAIYWSQSTGAHVIYGDLLDYFTNSGMEVKLGYPSTDPISGNGVSYGCNSDTTVYQTFSQVGTPRAGQVTPRTMYTLCANARGKVTRGQVTLSGATTPGFPPASTRDLGEDDGRHDEDDDVSGAADVDTHGATTAPRGGSNANGRSTGSSRTPTSTRGGSTVLTPR